MPVGECQFDGCTRPAYTRGFCHKDYKRLIAHGVLERLPPRPRRVRQSKLMSTEGECSVEGCMSAIYCKRMCNIHYQRTRKHGEPGPAERLRAPWRAEQISSSGYRRVHAKGHPNADAAGRVWEHHLVMSEVLGRAIRPEETVHHRNGDKLDNRPENLELWSGNHPPGQRVEDLVAWARDLLDLYGADYLKEQTRVA